MRCSACGAEAVAEAVYCHKCGERLGPAPDQFPQDSTPAGQGDSPIFVGRKSGQSPTAEPPEEELWRGGYSSKALTGAWTASGLISLGLLVAGVFWVREAAHWLLLLLAMLLPWLYYVAVLCYRRMSVHYLLTTQRFIHESGVLRRVNNRIEVLDMDDITFEQSLLERLTGVGTIRIVSHDRTTPELLISGIENVKRVAGLFDDARLAERRRRGLHVEQI